jgi:2-keto-4-pentenoate hydratase/2-oxohepta-3-ene-1,7-dioic acid hydratase in catechol pathway
VHHEIELVVKINRIGKTISEHHAHRYYDEVGLGIDFTARDIQAELKSKGHPWERAKAFDGSAVVGGFVPLAELGKPVNDLAFTLQNHDQVVQSGETSAMLFSVDRLIAEVSTFMTLKMGDLLFTGTPEGVAAVQPGDRLTGRLEGRELFAVNIK